MVSKWIYVGVAALFIFIVLRVAFIFAGPATGNLVALQLTDPPQVPAGTQALLVAYSGLQVHLSNANNASGWTSSSGSGTVDLLAILNLTQTIGTAQLPANSSINMVRFNVTGATIKINGTTYNVTVPSSKVTGHVTGKTTVNGTSSVLLQLSPTVASIITNSSTVFVLVPSLRAVVVPGATNATTLKLGAKTGLTQNHKAQLQATRPNLTITGASVSVGPGNVTHISVTVRDNSNSSIFLQHVGMMGNLSVQLNTSSFQSKESQFISQITTQLQRNNICAYLNASASGKPPSGAPNIPPGVSVSPGVPSNVSAATANSLHEILRHTTYGNEIRALSKNFSTPAGVIQINASVCTASGLAALTARLHQMVANYTAKLQSQHSKLQFLIFSIASSGSLALPTTDTFANSGFTIQAGQSMTFRFDGVVSVNDGQMRITPIPGSAYKVGVEGKEGARVISNVTATASS